MNVTEIVRGKLIRRYERVKSCDNLSYDRALRQFWRYLNTEPLLSVILDALMGEHPEMEEKAQRHDSFQMPEDEREEAASAAYFIRRCVRECGLALRSGESYVYTGQAIRDIGRRANAFTTAIVQPLALFLEEALDDARIVFALLLRYKQKCEWFQKDTLRDRADKGEEQLARHLREYLFDQGLEVHAEPSSASGKSDIVGESGNAEPLIADAKVFKGQKKPVTHGVNQVYSYLQDYNQRCGYLVVFNMSGEDLHLRLDGEVDAVQFMELGDKRIYAVVVDIADRATASKRGKPKAIEISSADVSAKMAKGQS